MSFTSRYSASPSNFQRDYAILQGPGSSYRPFQGLADDISESEDDDADAEAEGLTASSTLDEDEGASNAGPDLPEDEANMSNISVHEPTQAHTCPPARQGLRKQSMNSLRSSVHSSGAAAPPPHGLTYTEMGQSASGRPFSSSMDPSRSPQLHARAGHPFPEPEGGYPRVAGVPATFLLGGTPVMPPHEAENVDAGEHRAETEGERTPMPALRTGWLNTSASASATARPGENTPLLSGSISGLGAGSGTAGRNRTSVAGSSMISGSGASGYGHGHGHGRGRSDSRSSSPVALRPPLTENLPHGAGSAWAFAEPPPPGVEELAEIVHESAENPRSRETSILVWYSIPIWATHLLESSLNIVSVFSLGRLGTIELAAASLSSMTANVTGFSIIAGFISALDTLLPQAYSNQPKSVGLWTQRMSIVIAALLPFITLVWYNAESLLINLGQDPQVAAKAGMYLRIVSFGLPGFAGFEICRRYLQAQGLMHAPTIVLFVASPFNVVANYLLVWGPDKIRLGFIGAPIASAASMWLMFVLCFLQCVIAPRTAWAGWTWEAWSLRGMWPCITLGLAGTLSLACEWWAWEIVGLVTSALGSTALAAQSVLLVSSSITYQLPFAMSVATAVRVGNLLGAGHAADARISAWVSLALSLLVGTANSLLFLVFRKQWGSMFSTDPQVVQLVARILPIVALFQIADGVCGIAGGILRGTGRQAAGAAINLTAYYIVGIPIGIALTFSKLQMGLPGLWIGLTIALVYGAVGSTWFIARTDWDHEVRKVHRRMGIETGPKGDPEVPDAASPSPAPSPAVVANGNGSPAPAV